jgi:hypothetical protein
MMMFSPLYNYFSLNTLVTLLLNYRNFKLIVCNLGFFQSFSFGHMALLMLCFKNIYMLIVGYDKLYICNMHQTFFVHSLIVNMSLGNHLHLMHELCKYKL